MADQYLEDLQIDSQDQIDIIQNTLGAVPILSLPVKAKRGRIPKPKNTQFICGCGNVYSCTSALSLHVKNKHNGQPPEGSIGYPTMAYRKRGGRKGIKAQISSEGSQQIECVYSTKQIVLTNKKHTQINIGKTIQQQLITSNQLANQKQANQYKDLFNDQTQSNADQAIINQVDAIFPQKKKRGKGKYKTNRQYVSKRLYICGCQSVGFGFLEEMLLHVKQQHGNQIPDGSIFGLKREFLLTFFQLAALKPNPARRYYLFRCGCGKEYSCSSSLYYHIKIVHGGSQPLGTFGTTKQ